MKKINYIIGSFLLLVLMITSCKDDTYEIESLDAPSNLVINTEIVGQSEDSPNGDGSGEVIIDLTADNALTYHIGFNLINDFGDVNYSVLPSGMMSKKLTDPGVNTYKISVIAYGPGGAASNTSKEITVRSDFDPGADIITFITNNASKTWVVDKDVPAHFGVGPWGATNPEWWQAGVDAKIEEAPCFYTQTFTFTQNENGTFKLDVEAPDGVFTKTGDLTNVPGMPADGEEGCYSGYDGGSSSFNFAPRSNTIPITEEYPSTEVAIKIATSEAYIGYGSLQNDYEILEITPDFMHLRVQGTETGNGWWLKLRPVN